MPCANPPTPSPSSNTSLEGGGGGGWLPCSGTRGGGQGGYQGAVPTLLYRAGGGDFGRVEFRGEKFAVRKSSEIFAPAKFSRACVQQFHCDFRCRWIQSPPGHESKLQDSWRWRNFSPSENSSSPSVEIVLWHPPPPPGMHAQPLSPRRQVPASMAFVTDSNRPQPLWQPPPTASLPASGTASEVLSLLTHPCPPPLYSSARCWVSRLPAAAPL